VDLVLVLQSSINRQLDLLVLLVQELAVLVQLVLRMDSMLVVELVLLLEQLVVGIQRYQPVVLEQLVVVLLRLVVALVLLPSLRTKPYQRICVLRIDFLSYS
jgi:hypothetical protein